MSLTEDLELLAHELECDPGYGFKNLSTSDGDKFPDKLARVRAGVAQIESLLTALKSANEICRSALAIANRDGQTTNWDAFRERTRESLELQHRTLFPGQ